MASEIPSTTKAIVVQSKGKATIESVPTPKLRDGYVLVRVTAVALNPTDWKHIEFYLGDTTGSRVGCDVAGVVVAVGPNLGRPFAVGDRIAGGAHGSNQHEHEDGVFAEYAVVKADLAFKIPSSVTDEDASTIPLGATTVGQALYQSLKMNLPTNPLPSPEPFFIYGAATATGILAIQFAKLSGYYVIASASPHNFDYLRSLGADVVLDYHNETALVDGVAAAVKEFGKPLRLAFDCISYPATATLTAKVLNAGGATDGLHYTNLLPTPADAVHKVNANIENSMTLYYTAFGEPFEKPGPIPAQPEHLAFAHKFWDIIADLVNSGKLKAARAYVNRGGSGLEGVLVGLEELKTDKVSGGKLVYTIGK